MLHLALALLSSLPVQEAPVPTAARVLMVGIDGVRPDALLAAKTPNLDLLSARGQLTLEGRTTRVTSSGPAWTSILTGAQMLQHGVRDNSFEGRRVNAWPLWLERLERERPEAFTAAISQWAPIHEHLTQGRVDYSVAASSQAEVTRLASELLLDPSKDLTGLFLHYDDVDHAGHSHGYSPTIAEYVAAIEAVDAEVGKLLDALRARRSLLFEDWLILVGTDHGGLEKSHGEDVPECRTVFQLACQTRGGELQWSQRPQVVDFAALALTHLGLVGSCIPTPRDHPWWDERQALLNQRAAAGGARIVFLGDSITQGWEREGAEVWESLYAPRAAVNLGISGDRTEHVLWRLRHGNLKNLDPEVVVLMIGTNNSVQDDSEEIFLGVQAVVAELLTQLPETQVLLLAIFPRGENHGNPARMINTRANQLLEQWAKDVERTHFLDLADSMLSDDGRLAYEVMPDLLHPSELGFQIWASAMAPTLDRLLEEAAGR